MEDFISEITISGSRIDEDQAWRIDRIQRVIGYAQALADIDDNEFLLKAILEINDSKGILTVYWKENPKPEYKEYFDKAWESIVADYESVKVEHHYIMNTYTINEYLLELVKEASKELLKIYFDKPNRKTLLKFPKYKNGEIRISEQELRFGITNLHGQLSHPNLYYSIETPTENDYSFDKNAKGKRSAASDLSFYHNDEKVLNIEFKAHNPEQNAIDKDIEKLASESCNGAWIHIFKNEDRGTVKTLFEKFEKAFHKLNNSKKPISFHILIIETQTLLSRKGKENENNYSNNIFNIDYPLWHNLNPGKYQFNNGKQTTETNPDEDWQIDKFDIDNEI